MKIAISFPQRIVVFCCTFMVLFCFAQLSGCSYSSPTPKQSTLANNNSLTPIANITKTKKSYVVKGKRYYVLNNANNYHQVGTASWYGKKFQGRRTSTSERYNLYGMTAASPVLPLPTYVKVTNLTNGKQVIVKVNDRGPFRNNRILDLSYAAAKKLGFVNKGVAPVEVESLEKLDTIIEA